MMNEIQESAGDYISLDLNHKNDKREERLKTTLANV